MTSLGGDVSTRWETERLILRSFQPGDGEWYFHAGQRNREHLAEFESSNVALEAKSVEQAEAIVRDMASAWTRGKTYFLAGFEKATGEFAAQIYLGTVNADLPEYEIGYFADAAHVGCGYVTEAVKATLAFAFEQLGTHRVSLECDDTNTRSWRVAERCGFVKEGHRRENKKHADGSFTGTLYYGLLREEFESRAS